LRCLSLPSPFLTPPPPAPARLSLLFTELAPQTARAYYRYGEALLRLAQASTDVFGARVKAAADQRAAAQAAAEEEEAGGEGGEPGASPGAATAPPADAAPIPAAADAKGKGKAAAEEGGDGAAASGSDEEGEGEEEGDDAAAADSDSDEDGDAPGGEAEGDGGSGDDTDLAWEALDAARAILSRALAGEGGSGGGGGGDGPAAAAADAPPPPSFPALAADLADVHVALGDVAAEQERWGDADAEYAAALGCLEKAAGPAKSGKVEGGEAAPPPPPAAGALPPALAARRRGEAHFKRCIAAQLASEGPPGAVAALRHARSAVGALEAAVAASKAAGDGAGAADAEAVRADLAERVVELEGALTAAADQKEGPGEAGGGTVFGSGPSNTAATAAAPVRDLGVVGGGGREAKRLKLEPVGAAGGGAPGVPGGATLLMAAACAPVAVPAGFGAGAGAAALPPPPAPAPGAAATVSAAAAPAKPPAAAPAAAPAPAGGVPAFLQPAAVAAVYGEEGGEAQK